MESPLKYIEEKSIEQNNYSYNYNFNEEEANISLEIEEYENTQVPILIHRLHEGYSYLFFDPATNAKATIFNQQQLIKSGLQISDIENALKSVIDLNAILVLHNSHNKLSPDNLYKIELPGSGIIDTVFTEAVHQFQIANYLNPADHDGVIGQSTIETLGFINHGLKPKLNSSGFYGQVQLNKSAIKPQVPILTNNEFTAANWYQYIMKPSWLGVKISNGIHLLLLRKLREAETWLLSQPQYKGMTPATLGKALGFNADTRFSAARLSAEKQAMHGYGLALDINVSGNPWIGAGWVKYDKEKLMERTRMLTALKKASGNQQLPGNNVFEYLHSIAQSFGDDTTAAYKTLKQRNDEFVDYLKKNPTELSYWRKSQSFGNRNPLNGFLNLHHDLVYALRQVAGLAWGAIDFGPRQCGDIMHFDLRTMGIGKFLCEERGGFVPKSGHPAILKEILPEETEYEEFIENDYRDEGELHEAIEEASWEDTENEMNYFEALEENDPGHEHYESEEQENNEEYNSEENAFVMESNSETDVEAHFESAIIEDTFTETETGWWSKHRFLNKGDKGEDVGRAQNTLDKNWGIPVKVTKVYDDDTVAAVKKFQQMQSLEEDGKMGPFTHAALFESNYRYTIQKPKIIKQALDTCWAASIESAAPSWKGRTPATISSLLSKYKSLLKTNNSIDGVGLAKVLKDFNVANIIGPAKEFRIEIVKRELLATGSHLLFMYMMPGATLSHWQVIYGFGVRKGVPYLLTMDPLSGSYEERDFHRLQNVAQTFAIAWPN